MALDRAVEAYTPYLSAVVWNAVGASASAEGSGFSVPVQELTERLGGTFSQDAAKVETACTYRGVTIVLQAGNETALVDGEAVGMFHAPAMQDGVLAAGPQVFRDAWGIDIHIQREKLIRALMRTPFGRLEYFTIRLCARLQERKIIRYAYFPPGRRY